MRRTNLILLEMLVIISIFVIGCDKEDNKVPESNCTISGMLLYDDLRKGWEIHETVPNTIDSVNIYIITNKYTITIPKDSMVNVQATGLCSPYSDQVELPAGTTLYNLYVKHLNYY